MTFNLPVEEPQNPPAAHPASQSHMAKAVHSKSKPQEIPAPSTGRPSVNSLASPHNNTAGGKTPAVSFGGAHSILSHAKLKTDLPRSHTHQSMGTGSAFQSRPSDMVGKPSSGLEGLVPKKPLVPIGDHKPSIGHKPSPAYNRPAVSVGQPGSSIAGGGKPAQSVHSGLQIKKEKVKMGKAEAGPGRRDAFPNGDEENQPRLANVMTTPAQGKTTSVIDLTSPCNTG